MLFLLRSNIFPLSFCCSVTVLPSTAIYELASVCQVARASASSIALSFEQTEAEEAMLHGLCTWSVLDCMKQLGQLLS